MSPLIVPKGKHQEGCGDDRELYRARHLTAKAPPHLRRWRGTGTRYAKHTASLPATLHIRTLFYGSDLVTTRSGEAIGKGAGHDYVAIPVGIAEDRA